MTSIIRLILLLPRKYRLFCVLIIFIALLMSASEVIVLSSIKPFFQSFTSINVENTKVENSIFVERTLNTAIRFLITVIICGALRVFLIFFQYQIAAIISSKISSISFEKVVNQPYLKLKSANQSMFLSMLIQDIPRTSEAISNFASFVSNIIILIFVSISLLIIETKLFLISGLFISFLYFLILLNFSKRIRINGDFITKYNHLEASLVRSTLASIVDFIVGGSSDNQIIQFASNEYKLRKSQANTLIYAQSPRYIVETFCLVLFTLFIITSVLNNDGIIIFAQLGTLLFAFNRVLPAAQQTYSAYAFIKSSSLSIKNLIYIQNLKSIKTISQKNNYKKSNLQINLFDKKYRNQISLHNLNFEYQRNKKIEYDDFVFKQGIPTAILGKSGSGKTTLIELILRLLKPSSGQVKLNNNDLENLDINWYYQNVSYLAQSPFLFSGSISENIHFGNNINVKNKEIYENGKILGLVEEFGDDFLNYQISDFGRNISGGQAQRCSLLKILSNIKPITIIDEPSSSLDEKTSMIFNKLLLSKTLNSILIVITHSSKQYDLFPSKLNLS